MSLTPDWVKDAVFYQIFPDRFAKSNAVHKSSNLEPWDSKPTPHGYKGGDLHGVIEHLDHLEALGVNAIYFCPVFQSGANHRYHTHDYYTVDPMLGGNDALKKLLEAAHARGMKVVLDGVFNHASRGFFQFHDILENGSQSAYLDWFHVRGFPLNAYQSKDPPNYEAWWGYPALPEFNTDTPAVREYLWGVAEFWMKQGIDGWRLDVPNEINDDSFWQEFRRRVKNVNPEGYIVGEIWETAKRWLQGDQFDAVMNYVFSSLAYDFLASKKIVKSVIADTGLKHLGQRSLDGAGFAKGCADLLALYPWDINLVQLNLLGSHDTPRVGSIIGGDLATYKLLTVFQMGFVGAPCIYYGDEVGLLGERDPDCRRGMPWDTGLWNKELLEFTRKAVAARKRIEALRRGEFRVLETRGMAVLFERKTDSSRALVGLNAGETAVSFDVSGVYADAFSGTRVEGQLELVGRSGTILEAV
jgi:cyclomaltodextrinase / maltogenic alpha-amylase / neopullulanase